jgi:hypothetical protein
MLWCKKLCMLYMHMFSNCYNTLQFSCVFQNLLWLLHHKLRNVLQCSRRHFSFVNRINKGYLHNWQTFQSNAGVYWSSRRTESVLLHIIENSCSFCYFKGIDIWVAFVINKSVVRTELFWVITQRVSGNSLLRIKNSRSLLYWYRCLFCRISST